MRFLDASTPAAKHNTPEFRSHLGTFLCLILRTSELVVGTSAGVFRAHSAKRQSILDRVNPEIPNLLVVMLWTPVAEAPGFGNTHTPIAVGLGEVDQGQAGGIPMFANVAKRLYITRRGELQKYVPQANCADCTAAFLRQKAKPHSDYCKRRILQCMMKDQDPRVRAKPQL